MRNFAYPRTTRRAFGSAAAADEQVQRLQTALADGKPVLFDLAFDVGTKRRDLSSRRQKGHEVFTLTSADDYLALRPCMSKTAARSVQALPVSVYDGQSLFSHQEFDLLSDDRKSEIEKIYELYQGLYDGAQDLKHFKVHYHDHDEMHRRAERTAVFLLYPTRKSALNFGPHSYINGKVGDILNYKDLELDVVMMHRLHPNERSVREAMAHHIRRQHPMIVIGQPAICLEREIANHAYIREREENGAGASRELFPALVWAIHSPAQFAGLKDKDDGPGLEIHAAEAPRDEAPVPASTPVPDRQPGLFS